ncbi:hypothetical protein [Sedimenticola thiotaurini]|uniref:Uncharacterized protein n=1 Tax=Sedimenticola thiotaurini TaxID=1543721 RepID=A0A0F7JUT4_9GAMM|nr:hypothetical protein [Sedimenticola thiotaurini]AKH19382.1 hypothetical protein AAY24_02370 [Sedimenticola thiotaurini]
MELSAQQTALLEKYDQRDILGLIRLVDQIRNAPDHMTTYRRLRASGRLATSQVKQEQLTAALIDELEEQLNSSSERVIQANYFEIAKQLRKKFGSEVADVYLASKMPDDFLTAIRQNPQHSDSKKLTDDLVAEYKNALVRIEKGRRIISALLQPYSNFPLKNADLLNSQFNQLHERLRNNYKYLSVKPFLMKVIQLMLGPEYGQPDQPESGPEPIESDLFRTYRTTGIEPDLATQVSLHLALLNLLKYIKKHSLLPEDTYRSTAGRISSVLQYRSPQTLSPKARKILNDLLVQINSDEPAILHRLSATFIDEYLCAEEQMRLRHRMIESELAFTNEFLKQIAPNANQLSEEHETKIRIALEKLVCLKGVFELSRKQKQNAAEKPFAELERSALSISTALSPTQLANWIKIYSILFSNETLLAHSRERLADKQKLELERMRGLISKLTTYHLIQNIAQLKVVVDRTMLVPDDEKTSHFKQFSEILKIKLQGLMDHEKQKEKSLREMIDELVFLNNESAQFVIAETFAGFQDIVDAFNASASDYFVRDREALLKESRTLYNEICNQCLKNMIKRPALLQNHSGKSNPRTKKASWIRRLLS